MPMRTYLTVELTLAWPNSTCTVRRSAPLSIMWVAKQCRNVCGETRLRKPADFAATLTAAWIAVRVIGRVGSRPGNNNGPGGRRFF